MKKFSDFIVEKRRWILSIMLIITLVSALFIPSVKINKDLTKYLPEHSQMNEGLKVMEKEFPDVKMTGSIRVMFKDLSKDRIPTVLEHLKSIEYVSSVGYNDSENYNKAPYTLFEVQCNYEYGTKEEQFVEESILKEYGNDNIAMQHSISTLLQIPFWVYIIVLAVLLLILFLMCSSYVEPFLFLFTIGVAIVINTGTNALFPSVAETTFTLSAILQLALSMDYSVILMNRYRQLRENSVSIKEAMKSAYRSAMPSILSSGLTTVLGLVMLIFMRFKIGLDLGRVIAKGVAISMLCVLTVLPALILIFDKAIVKTKKKPLNLRTKWLATFNFKGRKVLAVMFALFFVGTALLQGLTKVTFAQPKDQTILSVFPVTNPVVVLYSNKDEAYISSITKSLSEDEKVENVLDYGSTVGKPLTSEEMTKALKEFSKDFEIHQFLVDFVYYDYYNKNKPLPNLTLKELYDFIEKDLLKEEALQNMISGETLEQLQNVKPFFDKAFFEKEMTAEEFAALMKVKPGEAQLVYSMILSKKPEFQPSKMSITEFISFMEHQIAENPAFAPILPEGFLEQFNKNTLLFRKETLKNPVFSKEMAELLRIDEKTVGQIYLLKFGKPGEKLSPDEFIRFTKELLKQPQFAASMTEEQRKSFETASHLLNLVMEEVPLDARDINALFPMGEDTLKMMFIFKDVASGAPIKLSLYTILQSLRESDLGKINPQIKAMGILSEAVMKDQKLSSEESAVIFSSLSKKVTSEEVELLYTAYAVKKGTENKLSIADFVFYLESDILTDKRFSAFIDENMKKTVKSASEMILMMKKNTVGENHSILLLNTMYPEESRESSEFIMNLHKDLTENCKGEYYLIGNTPMNVELEHGFKKDLILITALSVIAIFIVVALTFRSFAIPLILVLIVQCGVYFTVLFSGLLGRSIYYLSLLVVQCILMGATIDYGIVFTSYYLDNRKGMEPYEAMKEALRESIHTILTSSFIIILITGIIGICPADPAITEICQTISIGTGAVLLLILFLLPGLLVCFDKAVYRKKKKCDKVTEKESEKEV